MADTSELERLFADELAWAFPWQLVDDFDLVRLAPGTAIYGTAAARENPRFRAGDPEEFLRRAPNGYLLTGFGRSGDGAWTFYYIRADDWGHLFFRFPNGGLPSRDPVAESLRIREFMIAFVIYEPWIKNRATRIVAVETPERAWYEAVLKDGRVARFNRSLFDQPDFDALVSREEDLDHEWLKQLYRNLKAAGLDVQIAIPDAVNVAAASGVFMTVWHDGRIKVEPLPPIGMDRPARLRLIEHLKAFVRLGYARQGEKPDPSDPTNLGGLEQAILDFDDEAEIPDIDPLLDRDIDSPDARLRTADEIIGLATMN